jgi:hypothetical protein
VNFGGWGWDNKGKMRKGMKWVNPGKPSSLDGFLSCPAMTVCTNYVRKER